MGRGVLEVPVVTAVRFDQKGNSVPYRIIFAGKTLYADSVSTGNLVAFRSGDMYYWLEKNGRRWNLIFTR